MPDLEGQVIGLHGIVRAEHEVVIHTMGLCDVGVIDIGGALDPGAKAALVARGRAGENTARAPDVERFKALLKRFEAAGAHFTDGFVGNG